MTTSPIASVAPDLASPRSRGEAAPKARVRGRPEPGGPDAFGNALGNSIVGHMKAREVAAADKRNRFGIGADYQFDFLHGTVTAPTGEAMPIGAGSGGTTEVATTFGHGTEVAFLLDPALVPPESMTDVPVNEPKLEPAPKGPPPLSPFALTAADAGALSVLGSGLTIGVAGLLTVDLASRRFDSFAHPHSFLRSEMEGGSVIRGTRVAEMEYGDYTSAGGMLNHLDWEYYGRPPVGNEPSPLASTLGPNLFYQPGFDVTEIGDYAFVSAAGRRGNDATRADIDLQRNRFLADNPDWIHSFGGTDLVTGEPKAELFVPGHGGGVLGSTWPDLTFQKPDGTFHHHNTVDTHSDGITLTTREMGNLLRLQELRPLDTTSTTPKPKR